jgi:hypothetical protein
MNTATKERRLAKAKLLLNRLKEPATKGQLIFFSETKKLLTRLKNEQEKQPVAVLRYL